MGLDRDDGQGRVQPRDVVRVRRQDGQVATSRVQGDVPVHHVGDADRSAQDSDGTRHLSVEAHQDDVARAEQAREPRLPRSVAPHLGDDRGGISTAPPTAITRSSRCTTRDCPRSRAMRAPASRQKPRVTAPAAR